MPSTLDDTSPSPAPLGGSRAQAVQRLQVGLAGLAAMILLIGLASVINANRQRNEAEVVTAAAAPSATPSVKPAADPLVDAGVVPDLPPLPAPEPQASEAAVAPPAEP